MHFLLMFHEVRPIRKTRNQLHLIQLAVMLLTLALDALRFLGLCLRPSPILAAESLFLRKQLALYQERHVRLRRTTDTTRIAMLWLGRWFDWQQALGLSGSNGEIIQNFALFRHYYREAD